MDTQLFQADDAALACAISSAELNGVSSSVMVRLSIGALKGVPLSVMISVPSGATTLWALSAVPAVTAAAGRDVAGLGVSATRSPVGVTTSMVPSPFCSVV